MCSLSVATSGGGLHPTSPSGHLRPPRYASGATKHDDVAALRRGNETEARAHGVGVLAMVLVGVAKARSRRRPARKRQRRQSAQRGSCAALPSCVVPDAAGSMEKRPSCVAPDAAGSMGGRESRSSLKETAEGHLD
eukprot:364651-Chlamydomonas_euryale.AAC.5